MNCRWCSNPEGILPYPAPLYNAEKCIYDGLCVNACDKLSAISIKKSAVSGQHSAADKEELIINRDLCKGCIEYKCAESCNTGALKIAGYNISIEDLFNRLQRDRNYWGENGGITLTGGEPFSQPEFATELLKKCYKSYIHTAIETCGNVPWKYYAEAIDYIDWLFYDIKHTDNLKHREWTGVSNKLLLENAEKLAKHYKGRLIIRIPVVPGFNDSDNDVSSLADFMNNAGLKEVNILPLHHLGREKYKLMNMPYFNAQFIIPSQNKMIHIRQLLESKGLLCYEADKTPF